MPLADIRTSAGTTLKVSATAPATYNAAGFGALTFTEVSYVSDLGEFGGEDNLVTFNPLSTRTTVKRKGSRNAGSISAEMARAKGDAGQNLIQAAAGSDLSYSFLVTIQDGTKFYFSAQTMSFVTSVGSVDDITMVSAQLELDNEVIVVAV